MIGTEEETAKAPETPRSQYGSVNPAAIVGAAIIATTISTLAGILYCKCRDHHF